MISRLTFRLLAAASVSFGASATPSAQAQTSEAASAQPPNQTNSQQTGESPANLEEVFVTAQKRVERLLDVPVPVTAVTAEMLVESNKLRLQDYYSSVPGLNLTVGGFRGDPAIAIRGITTGGAFTSPTVGIVIDDVPFGSSIGLGGGATMPDIDPSDLAQIEILRGPQGTLYGASSLGGLVKYVTVDPSTDAVTGRVEIGGSGVRNGRHPGHSARGAVNLPLGDDFAVRMSGFVRREPGYIDNVQAGSHGEGEQDVSGGHISALWRASDAIDLKLSALLQQIDTDGSGTVSRLPGLGDLQQSYLPGSGGYKKKVGLYSATLTAHWAGVDLTSITAYGNNKVHDNRDVSRGFGTIVRNLFGVSGAVGINDNQTDKFTQEVRLSGSAGSNIDWIVGGFYTRERTAFIQNFFAVDRGSLAQVGLLLKSDYPTRLTESAGFADLTFHLGSRMSVQVGGRQSHLRQRYNEIDTGPYVPMFEGFPSPYVYPQIDSTDDAFTYLLTPQFRIADDLMAYARVASGYRAGGPNPNCTVYDIPCHFDPDKTTSYELGLKGEALDGVVSFDGSLYYIDWQDIQLNISAPISLATYTANASEAKSQGVELSVTARPRHGLSIAAWASWNDAVLSQAFPDTSSIYGVGGSRLPFASRFSSHFSVRQEFPLTSSMTAFASGSWSYVGNRVGDFTSSRTMSRTDLPGYGQLDLNVGMQRDAWTINAFITNLADTRGVLAGGIAGFNPTAFTYIRPRTVGLSVSRTFDGGSSR